MFSPYLRSRSRPSQCVLGGYSRGGGGGQVVLSSSHARQPVGHLVTFALWRRRDRYHGIDGTLIPFGNMGAGRGQLFDLMALSFE